METTCSLPTTGVQRDWKQEIQGRFFVWRTYDAPDKGDDSDTSAYLRVPAYRVDSKCARAEPSSPLYALSRPRPYMKASLCTRDEGCGRGARGSGREGGGRRTRVFERRTPKLGELVCVCLKWAR